MKKSNGSILIIVLIFISLFLSNKNTFGQKVLKYELKGVLNDSNSRKPIPFSSIALTTNAGKNIIKSGMSDENGQFTITGISPGKYDLVISSMSYGKKTKTINIAGNNPIINLGSIKITKQTVQLDDVVIEDYAIPVVVKEDTIEFNATSFKTDSNAMVEDLIKKLPGVEVDKDGNITAQGKQVKKVFVDGKPFFGDDPKMATKNIPVDMIDKVQVLDKKSDQAVFSGIDDGDVEKVMNLITKPGRKNGTFGKVTLGGGGVNDNYNKFDVGANINWFKGARQVSLISTGNNINNVRFSDFAALDQPSGGMIGGAMSFIQGGGATGAANVMRGRGGSFGNFNSNNSGINTSWSIGTNFRDSIGHKTSFSGSYLYTDNKTDKTQESDRETFLSDTSGKPANTFYNSNIRNITTSKNHTINLEFDYRIDSLNSILFRPRVKFTETTSEQISDYSTLDKISDSLNAGNSSKTRDNKAYNVSAEILFRHRFSKARRTMSLSIRPSYNSSNSDGNDYSNTTLWFMKMPKDSLIDQKKNTKTGDFSLNSRFSYTEPLTSNTVLEFNYNLSYDNSYSDKNALNYDTISKTYNKSDTTYTNRYENIFVNHRVGLNYKVFKEKWDYTIGVGVEPSTITSNNVTKNTLLTQNVVNFSPQANINYSPRKGKRMTLWYRGNTNQPSLSQLQTTPDNSNPLYITYGNPDLKPEFSQNVNINYNTMDMANFNFVFAGLNYQTTMNKIANKSTFDAQGRQVTTYTNVNGSYSLNAFAGIGKPIKKFLINFSSNAAFNNDISFNNSTSYTTQTLNWGANARLNYNGDKLTAAPIAKIAYYNANYIGIDKSATNYFNYTYGIDFQYMLPYNFKIGSDFQYTTNNGYGNNYNLTTKMWNAFITKQIFANKKGMLKFQVYDILQDNKSITRTTTDNYIEDTRVTAMPRFFMLSFSYSFSKFTGKRPDDNPMDRMMRHQFRDRND